MKRRFRSCCARRSTTRRGLSAGQVAWPTTETGEEELDSESELFEFVLIADGVGCVELVGLSPQEREEKETTAERTPGIYNDRRPLENAERKSRAK